MESPTPHHRCVVGDGPSSLHFKQPPATEITRGAKKRCLPYTAQCWGFGRASAQWVQGSVFKGLKIDSPIFYAGFQGQ